MNPSDRTATHLGQAPISLDGIAKSWIVERAGGAGMSGVTGIHGMLLIVGGDLRNWGEMDEEVAVADPRADGENAVPLGKVRIRNAALATSGGYRRYAQIGDRTFSHVIDPRTGSPANEVLSASEVRADGRRLSSSGWAALVVTAVKSAKRDELDREAKAPGRLAQVTPSANNVPIVSGPGRSWLIDLSAVLMLVVAATAVGWTLDRIRRGGDYGGGRALVGAVNFSYLCHSATGPAFFGVALANWGSRMGAMDRGKL